MSSYHCEVRKAVSRGKGQSVVAKAAYNNRTQLDNERFGEKTANYGRKGRDEVLLSGIFVPPNRNAPDWMSQDRNRLWNAAANAEGTTKNAREGQEIIAALPHELTDKQREFIVKDFARELARSTGRVIDVNIHRPPAKGDQRNYHVHMLMSVREIGPDGFGEKLADISPVDIREIKEKWSERGAKELRKAGLEIEAARWAVGHLDQEGQREEAIRRGDLEFAKEKEKEAGKHLGPHATAMEAKGIETDRGKAEREKFAEAQERESWKEELAEINREIALILEQQERALGDFDGLVASHPSLHPDRRYQKIYVDWLLQRLEMREEEKDQQRTLDYVNALIADAPQRMAEQRQRETQERDTRGGGRVEEDRQPAPRSKAPELGWNDGQIRMAFSLTKDGQSFANALEDRGMIVARVTATDIEKDSRKLRQQWEERKRNPETWMQHQGGYEDLSGPHKATARRSYENWLKADQKKKETQPEKSGRDGFTLAEYVKYVQGKWQEGPPQSVLGRAIGGIVIVTAQGDVHALSPRNTGMEKDELKAYLARIDRAPLLSVQDSRRVMGDVYQQARTEKIIAKNERYWPVAPPEQHAVKTSPVYHFEDGARSLTRETAPPGRIPNNLKGTAAEIWAAYNIRTHEQQWKETLKDGSKIDRQQTINLKAGRDPFQFAQALEANGIRLAQVTKEEAERSRTAAPFAKAIGSYTPLLCEGEFVAVDKRGSVYQLSQYTTGVKPWEVQRFLNKVEWKDIRGVTETARQERPQQQTRPQDLRGTAAEIWDAHQGAKTASQFVQKLSDYAKVLDKQGLMVAVVAERDKDIAQRQAPGAFVVVDQRGHVYALNERTTGRSAADAQKFMGASLDPRKFTNVTAARQFQIAKAHELRTKKGFERSDSAIGWGRGQRPTTVRSAWSGTKFGAKRVVSQTKATIAPVKVLKTPAQSIGKMLGGLFSALVPDPPKTPEQIAHIEKKAEQSEIDWSKFVYNTNHERAIASQQEQARYRQQEAENWKKDRDRDGRDR